MDNILLAVSVIGIVATFGAVGALLADWLEAQPWFIDWHRRNYQGRYAERKRSMATRNKH